MILAVHLLLPLSLASSSFFVAAPFGKSPQLAAVVSTFLAIMLAVIALVLGHAHDGTAVIFTLIFPPAFYIFAIRAIAGWENHLHPMNALQPLCGNPSIGPQIDHHGFEWCRQIYFIVHHRWLVMTNKQNRHLRWWCLLPSSWHHGHCTTKNVPFPELTCLQTLRVWPIKWSDQSDSKEDLEQLLRDCDLGKKIHANANTLSGSQKRKLQLAIGLLGGSSIVLVDECTSGVDPLGRHALWRTLTSFRDDRSVAAAASLNSWIRDKALYSP
ncbi:hypothetical protein NP233_g9966 [Leucocoprinus birnbaumii]|uniref:ABC transporter domain-containing protein n=1 Tax=Leucocoprinus birnbaumii TaxID=56174 RepID=A0AAD5VJF6_9AGAR|nr:hypothetical protein NP233_g9966 [Leucocoprinus birnbaumii]